MSEVAPCRGILRPGVEQGCWVLLALLPEQYRAGPAGTLYSNSSYLRKEVVIQVYLSLCLDCKGKITYTRHLKFFILQFWALLFQMVGGEKLQCKLTSSSPLMPPPRLRANPAKNSRRRRLARSTSRSSLVAGS